MTSPTPFRKHRAGAPPGFFRVEAAGLSWLSDTHTVPIVRVLDVGDDFIELERLQPGSPTRTAAVRLGEQLVAMHDAGASAFGCPPADWTGDGFIGDAPLPLRSVPTWGEFYAEHRVAPYLYALTTRQRAPVEKLSERLASGEFDDPAPPARIHGDLWSGNVVWTPPGAVLIDPAAHGGHRITDLAMLALFGAPHLKEILDAYASTSTHLTNDWRDLIPLHQIHPLLVHAVLFGGGYADQAARAASYYL